MQKRYNKFILKGSLALESYHDVNNDNHELFINYNKKLKHYRMLDNKTINDTKQIADEFLNVLEKIGLDNFIIYYDGDVEYLNKK